MSMSRAPEPPRTTHPERPGGRHRAKGGSGGGALGLRRDDFASDRSGVARARLRGRMKRWGRTALTRLHELDPELAATVLEDGGAQRVIFARPPAPELGLRAALALGIGPGGARVSLELPVARAPALRARLSDPARALEVSAAFQALPEQCAIGVDGDGTQAASCTSCTTDRLRQLFDRAEHTRRALRIEWVVPEDVASRHTALLEEEL